MVEKTTRVERTAVLFFSFYSEKEMTLEMALWTHPRTVNSRYLHSFANHQYQLGQKDINKSRTQDVRVYGSSPSTDLKTYCHRKDSKLYQSDKLS